jgi:phage-related protein
MARTQAVYYRDSRGRHPVDDFIETLPAKAQAALDATIDRLNDLNPREPPLAFPATSQVDGELRELRCHYGSELYRLLYRRSENLFVLLHAIRKRGAKIPRGDIDLAQKRWLDFRSRMDAESRRPPRAAGRDAP